MNTTTDAETVREFAYQVEVNEYLQEAELALSNLERVSYDLRPDVHMATGRLVDVTPALRKITELADEIRSLMEGVENDAKS